MKYLKVFLPVLIIVAGVFLGYTKLVHNKAEIDLKAKQTETIIAEIPVTTIKATLQELKNEIELIGTFEARKELNVIAEAQGRINRLYVKEGQYISRGQTIASIDDTAIKSQLATARASLSKAKKDVERYKNLLNVGAISQTQYEEVQLAMQNQESSLTAITEQLKYSTAKSPMSGVIKEIKLEEGSFANPGTEIATVVDINSLNLIVRMDEKDVVKVRQGQKVNIITEVYKDVEFHGKINQVAVQADAARKYEIAIELSNSKKHPLKAGMYGNVKIPSMASDAQNTVLTIPRKSVVGSLKNPKVYIALDGKATLTDIEVGETIEDNVIVLNGLNEGDLIITTGQINLDNGRSIKIISTDSSALTINQ